MFFSGNASVVNTAHIGGNQSERRKNNRVLFLGHVPHWHRNVIIFSCDPFRPISARERHHVTLDPRSRKWVEEAAQAKVQEKNAHTVLEWKIYTYIFWFNRISRGSYLLSGHVRRPGDVTPKKKTEWHKFDCCSGRCGGLLSNEWL